MERITFADTVRKEWTAVKRRIYVEGNRIGLSIEKNVSKFAVFAKRKAKSTKYYRLRDFYVQLVTDFQLYHDTMVYLVEHGDVKYNEWDRRKYDECKAKISAIIRAKKRLQAKRRLTPRKMLFYLNGYIMQERMRDKYQEYQHGQYS